MVGFLLSLQMALTAYINSSFLASFTGEKLSGLVYVFASILSIIAFAVAPEILEFTGSHAFLLSISALSALSLFIMSSFSSAFIAIPIFIIYFILNNVIIFSLDELLEIFSKNTTTGKIRGMYLMLTNLAWVVAQAFSAKISGPFPFSEVYFIGGILMLAFFLVAATSLRGIPDPVYDKVKNIRFFREFFKNKDLARSYKINFILQFFYVWMIIYTPIYLHAHLGFDWSQIATIFAIMLLPFVILQYPVGRYSDKIGERKMMIIGFTIASIATISLFFIQKPEVWIWALALFSTRVGAAIVEAMSDIYFFKHIKPENDEYIGIYRNAVPAAYILGPVFAVLALTFAPAFNFLFIILGALLLYGIYISSKIKISDN